MLKGEREIDRERVGCGKQGKLPHQFNPSKTATLVPEFAKEDFFWAELQTQAPRLQFCQKAGLPPQTQEPRLQFH